jgi:hypothetical protein
MATTTLSVEATREKKRGRPKKSWREEMMTAMQSRGLNIEDAQYRRLWRIGTGRQHYLYNPRIYILVENESEIIWKKATVV